MTVRVALADDDDLVRAGIALLLSRHDDIEVVVECADGAALVRDLRARAVDVVLLDIRMPRLDGLSTLDELVRTGVGAPVAMLTTFRQDVLVEEAVRRGARGFLLKSDSPDDLTRAVLALAEGGAVFSPRVASWLVDHGTARWLADRHAARARVEALTERQQQVLAHLSTGAGNAEIAAALHLGEGTVKQYLRAVFETLAVENRVQAALIGYQAGLADDARTDA